MTAPPITDDIVVREPVPYPSAPDDFAYHGIVGELIEAVGPISESDAPAIALQFLVAVGSIIGRGPYFPVGDTEHRVNENVLVVGQSAHSRKGDGLHRALVIPGVADNDWYAFRRLLGIATGEGLIYQVRDPTEAPKKVKENGIVVVKSVVTDPGVSDKRLFVALSEFASIARQFDRQGQTLSPVLRNAWDGGDLGNPSKNSPLRATAPHVSVVAHTTAAELGTLSAIEFKNGGVNRFLVCASRKVRQIPNPIPTPNDVVTRLSGELLRALSRIRGVTRMRRDDATERLWADIYADLEVEQLGIIGEATARGAAHVLRLSMIYALLDGTGTIAVEHLRAAWALWQFCADSVRWVFQSRSGDPAVDRLLDALRDAEGHRLTRTAVSGLWNNNRPIDPILKHADPWLKYEVEPTPGRNRVWVHLVNPR
jgi:hypothetical protein